MSMIIDLITIQQSLTIVLTRKDQAHLHALGYTLKALGNNLFTVTDERGV